MEVIKRVPIVQQVEEAIRQLIVTGQCPPLEKLPAEMELCQQLGVGRGTVREAFRLLQAKGYVEIRPGRGAFVSASAGTADLNVIDWFVQNEKELRSSIEIRTALEPMAARLMAERCKEEDVAKLEQIHAAFLAAISTDDTEKIAQLDEKFHSTIVEGSKNQLLIRINRHVCQGMSAFRSKTFQVEENVKNAIAPHSSILAAIASHNAALAELEMRRHLDMVQQDLTANIRQQK